jgi:PIN domain nuclease of toxin-antitoxin system
MRLLLDSQAFIYIARDPAALPVATRSATEDSDNELYLSIATPLELQIKVNIGKLTLVRSVREAVQLELNRGSLRLLPITLDHIDELSRLPSHHKDPFDRLLIAQAIHENLTIVTGDETIARYPVQTLWQ